MTGRAHRFSVMHTEASDGWGGQEIRIFREILGMRQRGHTVVLAAPGHAKIFGRCEAEGVKCFDVKMDRRSFIPSVFRLSRIIRDEGIGIIGTHSSRDGWIGSLAGRLTGIPVVRYRHISSELKRDPLTKLGYRHMNDAIITTGDFISDMVVRDLGVRPGKVHTVATGVNMNDYSGAGGARIRRELGLEDDAKVIGCAAVLRSWKGHEYIIRAMPRILSDYPGAKLLLAGEGPRREILTGVVDELGLRDSVILMGHRDDIADVIAAFDVSVLASYASEGIPQFLLQSMASKKPVIGARTGGIPEVVEDGVNGFVVPPRDENAIADAALRILGDPETAARMGEAGQDIIRERHTLDIMLDRIEAVYGGLTGGGE